MTATVKLEGLGCGCVPGHVRCAEAERLWQERAVSWEEEDRLYDCGLTSDAARQGRMTRRLRDLYWAHVLGVTV